MKNPFNISGRTKGTMVIGYCLLVIGVTACTDTWDDHYEGQATAQYGMSDNTLWQAIKDNPQLSNFASVAEACGFDRTLNSAQVLTVFAPTNDCFSKDQAQELIARYQTEKANGTLENDNTVMKEFIQNHVALFNFSVSDHTNDSIRMMNGKKLPLLSNKLGNASLLSKNALYSNGILFTVGNTVEFLPNVFEYIRKDPDLDSLRTFLYSGDPLISGRSYPQFYYKEFMPSLSVAGSIMDGKTQYLDSVFIQRNRLFETLGNLHVEDSAYIFLAPTNEEWSKLVEEYEPYFNYREGIDKRDSLVYRNTRLAIMEGTTFSRTFNTDESLRDSAMSVNCVREYAMRSLTWGQPFEYYQYYKPMNQNGALAETEVIRCSNGEVRKAPRWNIDKRMTFNQYIVVEAEYSSNIKDVRRAYDTNLQDSVNMATVTEYSVPTDNVFRDRVWDNGFVEVTPTFSDNIYINFYLNDVLSNIPYDIYLVTVPALASDSDATAAQRLPTKLRCTISSPGVKRDYLSEEFSTTPNAIDYLLVAENYTFDYCTYGLTSANMQSVMEVETRVKSSENDVDFSRTLRIDCILLVPHGSLQLVDALPASERIAASAQGKPGVLLYPHGQYTDRDYKYWYMLR